MIVIGVLVAGSLGMGVSGLMRVPFYVDKGQSMSVTNLKLYAFQPVYLWSFEKKGGVFVKAFYLGKWNLPRVADLWISGEHDGMKLNPAPYVKDKKRAGELARAADFEGQYKFGDRIRVDYVTGAVEEKLAVIRDDKFCEYSPRVCQVQEIARKNFPEYAKLSSRGWLSWKTPLPVLGIDSDLEL